MQYLKIKSALSSFISWLKKLFLYITLLRNYEKNIIVVSKVKTRIVNRYSTTIFSYKLNYVPRADKT